jgi:hypothetical protein
MMTNLFYRTLLVGAFGLVAAAAAEQFPNLASCTNGWDYDRDGKFGSRNMCEFAAEIQFMTHSDPHPLVRIVDEAEPFSTGLTKAQVEAGWWMYTACPLSFVSKKSLKPDIAFVPANREKIAAGAYQCVGD